MTMEMRNKTKRMIILALKRIGALEPGEHKLSNMDTLYMRKAVILLEEEHMHKPTEGALLAYCTVECGAPDDCVGVDVEAKEFMPCDHYKQFKKLLEAKED